MTTLALDANASTACPVIAWYNSAKRDCDAVWENIPAKREVVAECQARVDGVRAIAKSLFGVRGEGEARKKTKKALEELEDRLQVVKKATHRYGLALSTRSFFNAYSRYQAA